MCRILGAYFFLVHPVNASRSVQPPVASAAEVVDNDVLVSVGIAVYTLINAVSF